MPHYPNSENPSVNVKSVHDFIVDNKTSDLKFWETEGNIGLHELLMQFSIIDFTTLVSEIVSWDEAEQNILTDCVAYGLDGSYGTYYT